MANHVINRLRIEAELNTESVKSLEEFIKKARQISHIKNPQGWWETKEVSIGDNKYSYIENHLDMSELLPPPEWIVDYYKRGKYSKEESKKVEAWYKEYYGGPSYVFDDDITSIYISYNQEKSAQKKCYVEYRYETKWRPNINFIQNISRHYPTLRFVYNFHEETGLFYAKYIIANGKEECEFFSGFEDELTFDSEDKYFDFYSSIENGSHAYKLYPGVLLPKPSEITFIDEDGRHSVIVVEIDKQRQLIVNSWVHYDYKVAS